MTPLISVITPSLNSGSYLEAAIRSVLAQDYRAFEHVVVDGGSTDATLDVLRRYPHVRWTSEPDGGQSEAMNKGFARASGDVVVYLNADDWFEPGAFEAVAAAIRTGATFVIGRINVAFEHGCTINDPKTAVRDMLRWWRPDAYCYNSAGYFYQRDVQAAVGPFNADDHLTMDFEFLIEAARRFPFTKIPNVLATFRYIPGTKTFDTAAQSFELFRRFDKYLTLLEPAERDDYLRERAQAEEVSARKRAAQAETR